MFQRDRTWFAVACYYVVDNCPHISVSVISVIIGAFAIIVFKDRAQSLSFPTFQDENVKLVAISLYSQCNLHLIDLFCQGSP